MLHYILNIVGTEWIIIIFIALILILGTNKLPEAARKLGRASYQYNKAKKEVQNQMNGFTNHSIKIDSPVQNDREKFEIISRSLNIDPSEKTTEELKKIISNNIGLKNKSDPEDTE